MNDYSHVIIETNGSIATDDAPLTDKQKRFFYPALLALIPFYSNLVVFPSASICQWPLKFSIRAIIQLFFYNKYDSLIDWTPEVNALIEAYYKNNSVDLSHAMNTGITNYYLR